jgi:hypothetical protein
MDGKSWRVGALAAAFLLVALCGARAQDKAVDGGKAEKFKGKDFKLKAKGSAKIVLSFPEGKTATLTVRSKKDTDINLFVYDSEGKEVAKDDSPGPNCDIEFKPAKAGKYTLEIKNLGKEANTSTLKVSFGKKKKKPDAGK